ncbi:hypothetical protein OUZ56_021189 [Daphnia magna]|uniref:Uncharacterized protein n=1 Tax=Daphnia magna TaxID=35525 RepID=A0ABQ9ZGN3_9CRUS|nr:hypothetical protein OUZ56_021189 [Daphnia magna]
MAAMYIGTWKWMHVQLDVSLHMGGPLVMFADWSFDDTYAQRSMYFNNLLCPTME